MEKEIQAALTKPQKLEELYRQDKEKFQQAFTAVVKNQPVTELIRFWQLRLQSRNSNMATIDAGKLHAVPLLLSIVFVAFFMRFAGIFNLSAIASEMYEIRNPGLIVFMGLTLYGLLGNNRKELIIWLGYALVYVILALQMNTIPVLGNSQVLGLAVIHCPVVLWFLYGLAINNEKKNNRNYWIKYLQYNGDLFVFSGLILICWFIIFGLTTTLFDFLNIHNSFRLMEKYLIVTAAITPLLATFAIERIPSLGNKVVPLLARIFNPIVLVVLTIYMVIIVRSGQNLFDEREFLLLFDLILFSVLALIIFSLSNVTERGSGKYRLLILFLLVLLSCSMNVVALSAIIYRLLNFGITPNRVTVVAINLLVFGNLIKIGIDILQVHNGRRNLESVSLGIAGYLPLYGIWALFVVLVFPIIFP
ncbi:MAG: hypothetical protein K9N06_00815 [Candidatus Cloacimonetes bacterium]|nr:hypothetical protein [Candidatus Cloacimonadota bacterium]